MGNRRRVFSFMSSFSNRDSKSPEPPSGATRQSTFKAEPRRAETGPPPSNPPAGIETESPQPRYQGGRARAPSAPSGSRPVSMIQTYQPPLMELTQDTLPELQPIFTFLNSHANKLYQEGYFLKLDDQSVAGRANADRTWTECFAQLVGTVLSLWDAQELDAAGQDGEVLPKFINLTDASIKMIESLPTRSDTEAPLQNVLSISTAGKNRYLLHFNSHHSLIQWTAGIRLAMFEHATLQEAYTGALIGGKGKTLNNINVIMERSRLKYEDWARVRFGAGTPWRRCWCVITPPDEKDVQKLQKELKKKSAYDRSRPPILKGSIKFYDTKRTKKVSPIATITDAYSAFAIYPQSKPLIDASTLVKLEGSITIHSNPPSSTEGFVFVMPEVHPAVTGFEIMLRWLFPVFDTFGLYGRPNRLVADAIDPRSLMFAMPKHRRYGYLEILDVSSLILETGSSSWKESEWRKKMKDLTGRRMTAIENGSRRDSRYSSRRNTRSSFGPSRRNVAFDDGASIRSSPSMTWGHRQSEDVPLGGIPRTDSAPPAAIGFDNARQPGPHYRSVSETQGLDRYNNNPTPSGYDGIYEEPEQMAPVPPPHNSSIQNRDAQIPRYINEMAPTPERVSSEDERISRATEIQELQELQAISSPEPVATPPAFAHGPGALPISKPFHSPELRRANSRMSSATLSQLAGASGVAATYEASQGQPGTSEEQRRQNVGRQPQETGQRVVPLPVTDTSGIPANQDGLHQGLIAKKQFSFERPRTPPLNSEVANNHTHQHFPFTSSNVPIQNSNPTTPNSGTYIPASNFPTNLSNNDKLQQQPAVPKHSTNPSVSSTRNQPPLPHRFSTGQSIARKPLPQRSSYTQAREVSTPPTASMTSTSGHNFDQAAFDLIVPQNDNRKLNSLQDPQIRRQNSNISSVYEDAASTDSPDYASTRKSVDTRPSVERPRAGVMRTVGNVDIQPISSYDEDVSSSIPSIDFGPTINYASDKPPRQNNAATGRASPQPPLPMSSSRTPKQGTFPPNPSHYRVDSGESRTVAWQPGMGALGHNSSSHQAITPEQFVQQRAVATPMYAHQRQQPSSNLPRSGTPPLVRNRSSELLAQNHSRSNSADLLNRPHSRGPSAVLGAAGSGDYSSHLSAREQEHVAKVTGQPLINMASNNTKQSGAGLVGAIEAREKERQQMKQGLTSQAVQNAIIQRKSMNYTPPHDYRVSQSPGPYTPQSPAYGMGGQYAQSQHPNTVQRQQSWVSPAASVFAQGGGWAMPSYSPSPDYQQAPPQQYFPNQQHSQQQPQGRGNQGYHGHGS
ncbi:ph domain protein [Phlyctema vagabunda]|uniref:Ph domain protein n=1 Tax=Phlyctema vagabunda TaxID=108571 RepID=A0ABR4PK46_9HELO